MLTIKHETTINGIRVSISLTTKAGGYDYTVRTPHKILSGWINANRRETIRKAEEYAREALSR